MIANSPSGCLLHWGGQAGRLTTPQTKGKTMREEPTCPRQTPWGHADQVKEIAPGIWSVSTPGHGGIYVAEWRRATMPAYLSADTPYSGNGWFEEDCDWALACAAFPVEFGPRDCHYALATMTGASDYLKERRAKVMASPLGALLRAEAAKYQPEPVRERTDYEQATGMTSAEIGALQQQGICPMD